MGMVKTLSLVLALCLTGAPTFAVEFTEMPLGGETRTTPLIAGPGVQLPAQLGETRSFELPEQSLKTPTTALETQQAKTEGRQAERTVSAQSELRVAEKGGAPAFSASADGTKAASMSSEAVEAARGAGVTMPSLSRFSGDGGGDRSSPPWRRSGERREQTGLQRAWQWVKDVPTGWKVGVAVAVVIGATIFGFYQHSRAWNEFWKHSKSHSEIVRIDDARRRNDAAELLDIANTAQARQQRMSDRLTAAKANKQKRVEDRTHDKVGEAEALASYDGLVWSRARLNHNFATDDRNARIGEDVPSRWTGRETELEQDAVRTGFEGKLALSLQSLQGEIGRERGWTATIDGQLKNFDKHVPALFGGTLGGEAKKGRADLKEFSDREIAPEDALLAAKTSAMRGRVSDRIYSESGEFRGHRDRRDRLQSLFDAKVDPAYQAAKQIDDDLASMISHRNSEAMYMTMAALHTHDYAGEQCDSDGKNCHAVYEDNSGMYRMLAASEASSAAAAARSANSGLERLKPMVNALYADKTLDQEQLRGLLPKVQGQRVGEGGFDVFGDLLLHPLFGIFSGLSSASSGEGARSSFGPVLGALRALDGEVAGRRDGEIRWVEGTITADLAAQMRRAQEQLQAESPK